MNYIKLFISFVVCFSVALAASLITMPALSEWYPTLTKPSFTPPDEVFSSVWTFLYILIAIALYLIWKKEKKQLKMSRTMVMFSLQLVLNLAWSQVFFGLHSPLLGFIVIILLWGALVLTIIFCRQVSKAATFLLLPYFGWVSFALILNGAIVMLN